MAPSASTSSKPASKSSSSKLAGSRNNTLAFWLLLELYGKDADSLYNMGWMDVKLDGHSLRAICNEQVASGDATPKQVKLWRTFLALDKSDRSQRERSATITAEVSCPRSAPATPKDQSPVKTRNREAFMPDVECLTRRFNEITNDLRTADAQRYLAMVPLHVTWLFKQLGLARMAEQDSEVDEDELAEGPRLRSKKVKNRFSQAEKRRRLNAAAADPDCWDESQQAALDAYLEAMKAYDAVIDDRELLTMADTLAIPTSRVRTDVDAHPDSQPPSAKPTPNHTTFTSLDLSKMDEDTEEEVDELDSQTQAAPSFSRPLAKKTSGFQLEKTRTRLQQGASLKRLPSPAHLSKAKRSCLSSASLVSSELSVPFPSSSSSDRAQENVTP